MTRSRKPNLPPSTVSKDSDSMGEVRDTWLRTHPANNIGIIKYKSSNTASIFKASKPINSNFDPVQWVGTFFNGGADVLVYENSFLPPEGGSTNGAMLKNRAALFEQRCGGTIWPDSTSCDNTGLCSLDAFYKEMRQFRFTQDPWASVFPELLNIDTTPDP